jgi:hypothetical protein
VVYRPLALLALIGAGVAGLYAAIVVVGGLVAFFAGDPWLMPGWTVLFPVASAVLCWLGLVQIQRSEGTLAGDKVARWGLLLSLLVGLGYWAYVGATYFAITREANSFGQAFLKKLVSQDELSAFLLTLPPSERPAEGEGARAQVEARFNAGEMSRSGGGAFTAFQQSEPVRILTLGGTESSFESAGVKSWTYKDGGYQVELLYKVDTPQISYLMELAVQAKEGKGSAGRQWYALWNNVGMLSTPKPVMSPKGTNQLAVGMKSRDFLTEEWLTAMKDGKTLDVFLATLPAAERDRARQTAAAGLVANFLAAGAPPCGAPAATLARVALAADLHLGPAAVLPGLYDFLDGQFLHAGKDLFWAPEGVRAEVIDTYRDAFRHPDGNLAMMLLPDTKVRFPRMYVQGDRFVAENDFTTRIPFAPPRFMVYGRVVTDCDAAEAEAGNVTSWRVLRAELVSAKLPPGRPSGPGGPGGPNGQTPPNAPTPLAPAFPGK